MNSMVIELCGFDKQMMEVSPSDKSCAAVKVLIEHAACTRVVIDVTKLYRADPGTFSTLVGQMGKAISDSYRHGRSSLQGEIRQKLGLP